MIVTKLWQALSLHAVYNLPMSVINQLLTLYASRGEIAYEGEGVSQLEHARQCSDIAQSEGASDTLQLACFLHDVGHLIVGLPDTPTMQGVDDGHESVGGAFLSHHFPHSVYRPVALHVAAKRVLVAEDPRYFETLSSDSVRSLSLQGGPMTSDECARFHAEPFASAALLLRRYDERAKVRYSDSESSGRRESSLARLAALMEAVHNLPAGRH